MDIESDESERWEDFFGSSTDLGPSVIGYYDNLTNNIKNNNNIQKQQNKCDINKLNEIKETKNSHNQETNQLLFNKNKVRNFRVLSPTVQRMISHNSDDNVDDEENEINRKTSNHENNKNRLPHSNTLIKNSKIPLSKNTSKLTQSGNDYINSLECDLSSSNETVDNSKTPTNLIDDVENDLKTPTNLCPNSSFIFEHVKQSLENFKAVQNNSENIENGIDELLNRKILETSFDDITESFVNPRRIEYTSSASSSDSVFLRDKMKKHVPNKSLIESDSDDNYHDCVGEASNFYVRLPDDIRKSLLEESEQHDRTTVIFKGNPIPPTEICPPSPSTSIKEVKNEKKDENKLNITTTQNSNKLKHRPLSATSITSTSSSSSTGSENLTGKHNISYLASVESLADHSESELVNNNLTVSERAALEIIDSEKSYVEDLGQIINGYLTDWRERACLKSDQLNILFSNIEEIYEFNTRLLKQLTESNAEPSRIATCFITLNDDFDVYTTYCTNYPEAISLLTTLLQASHTNSLLASTQKLLKHTLPLGSYLLKPVQRILKYHLLLDNLRKHVDCEDVAKAHLIMRQVAHHIDQVKKTLEQQSRVKELSGILDGWLGPEFTVLGDLRQDGLLMENNKPRIVFLFKAMLIITKKKEDNRLQFKTYIQCKDLMLIEHLPGEPTSFYVIPFSEPRNQIKLTARNREEKRRWAHHIKQVMLEDFDIPNRAKELVFKLGDEEDRPLDKVTWKWGHSTTPEYLERRNQYRRSEMRYRSKKARKIVQSSKSLDDGFLNKNLDDNLLSRAKSNDTLIESEVLLKEKLHTCDNFGKVCSCNKVKTELKELNSKQNKEYSDTAPRVKSRSKSEPRIPANFSKTQSLYRSDITLKTDDDENLSNKDKYSTLLSSSTNLKKKDDFEIKMYNKKILPKRIANLKKNRAKTMKETSTFYMELKITESTDNLNENENINETLIEKPEETVKENVELEIKSEENIEDNRKEVKHDNLENIEHSESSHIKNDSDIISELLKENKEFDRILKKPPSKKKSFDNGSRMSSSTELSKSNGESETDLSNNKYNGLPIVESPSVVESINLINATKLDLFSKLDEIQNELEKPEPIYESLKRNVHVPYKYCPSPTLARSRSQPYTTNKLLKNKKEERPDSDYVTLDFTAVILQSIGKTVAPEISQLRNSDSNINYNKVAESRDSKESKNPQDYNFERHESFNAKYSKNILQRFMSVRDESMESLNSRKNSNDSINFKLGKPERRASDVTAMTRKSVIYKQGSENLGSRIAHLEYVDPKTLISQNHQTNILINKNSMKTQRDSVFSLTSSSDSVCDTAKHKSDNQISTILKDLDRSDSFYEDNVEECLENDNFFRDSAIYSDDNNERKCDENKNKKIAPQVPRKPNKQKPLPPPLPAKPKHLININNNNNINYNNNSNNNNICNERREAPLSPRTAEDRKSWVLKQIKNFDK